MCPFHGLMQNGRDRASILKGLAGPRHGLKQQDSRQAASDDGARSAKSCSHGWSGRKRLSPGIDLADAPLKVIEVDSFTQIGLFPLLR